MKKAERLQLDERLAEITHDLDRVGVSALKLADVMLRANKELAMRIDNLEKRVTWLANNAQPGGSA